MRVCHYRPLTALLKSSRAFSHDVTAAMLVFQRNHLGVEFFSYVNTFFCFRKYA